MSSSYKGFADYYDRLMQADMDYAKRTDYIENLFSYFDKSPELVADLACGTGGFTIPLARRGYDMIGVDRSEEMLTAARRKAADLGKDILFLCQDICRLDLYGTVDAFLCATDGINYIISPPLLFDMFKRIKTCFLNPGGIFIFDVSTEYKLSQLVGSNTFIHDERDLFYTWENHYIEKRKLSDMYLNFFVKENGSYRRFCERHLQRAYSEAELRTLLKRAGFEKIDVFDDLSFDAPKKTSERIIFAAR